MLMRFFRNNASANKTIFAAMKKISLILLTAVFFSFLWMSTQVGVINFAQLQKLTESKKNDTLYVVNFWATWCVPCVKEMPAFIEADKKFAAQKVKVIFVSLNSAKELPNVEKFTATKNILNPVFLLNAGNPNDWINKIDPSWSGSIPATAMYKKGKKVFFKEGGFTQEEIDAAITDKNK
jgi:thiol-disulfide isomerase/thioredoxin